MGDSSRVSRCEHIILFWTRMETASIGNLQDACCAGIASDRGFALRGRSNWVGADEISRDDHSICHG
jgi:hypothetical protein